MRIRLTTIQLGRYADPASRWLMLSIAGLALMMLAVGCNDDDGGSGPTIRHPQDFLPTQVSGWEANQIQTGTTESDLYGIINGGADIYARYNLKEFAVGDYNGTDDLAGAILQIWIYALGSAADAEALYNDSQIALSPVEAEPEIGNSARLGSISTGKKLQFIRNEYYMTVAVNQTTAEKAESQVLLQGSGIDDEIVK